MPSYVFFDDETYKNGQYFELSEPIRIRQGRRFDLGTWKGRGGNGAVFTARDSSSGEEYAIKFLLHDGYTNSKRFLREGMLLKLLQAQQQFSPDHTVRFIGNGIVNSVAVNRQSRKPKRLFFLVMELAQGNLLDVIRKNGKLPFEQYSGQFRGLAKALAALHAHAVHRDIKPENILVSGDRWLLSDYGLCSFVKRHGGDVVDLTPPHANVGPKFWMSPEAQNRRLGCGDTICKASDVFQLAAVFWYAATGRHPSGILVETDWSGPPALFELLKKSLLHNVNNRLTDGAELQNKLEEALTA